MVFGSWLKRVESGWLFFAKERLWKVKTEELLSDSWRKECGEGSVLENRLMMQVEDIPNLWVGRRCSYTMLVSRCLNLWMIQCSPVTNLDFGHSLSDVRKTASASVKPPAHVHDSPWHPRGSAHARARQAEGVGMDIAAKNPYGAAGMTTMTPERGDRASRSGFERFDIIKIPFGRTCYHQPEQYD